MLKTRASNDVVEISGICSRAECVNCSNGTIAIFMDIRNKDGSCTAKLWSAPSNDVTPYKEKAVKINGTVKEYKGVKELSVNKIEVLPDSEIIRFIPRLNYDELCKNFMGFLKSHIDQNYYEALKIVFEHINFDKFVTGYAATSHHDNISGGLINHTLKMLQIAEVLFNQHSELEFMKNRIYTGIVLHDIGKINCYNAVGGVAEDNYVDHKAIGIMILAEVKDKIIEKIGEAEYKQIIAIILGHHDEYGEPAHSVATKIINFIDILDAQVTYLIQLMTQVEFKGDIKFDNKYLHI